MELWRLIVSNSATGYENMAFDEAMFLAMMQGRIGRPTIRLYSWRPACVSIGYFQKYNQFLDQRLTIVRRMTGGLAFVHISDLSYAMIVNESDWPFVYNQAESYRLVHLGIKEGLAALGINTEFLEEPESRSTDSAKSFQSDYSGLSKNRYTDKFCEKSLFPYDLRLSRNKVVGSCQRRRKKILLQQGSIKLPSSKADLTSIALALKKGWEEAFNRPQPAGAGIKMKFNSPDVDSEELRLRNHLKNKKYVLKSWNEKF